MNKEYMEGFIAKCAEAGIDPEELVKLALSANTLTNYGIKGLKQIRAKVGPLTIADLIDPIKLKPGLGRAQYVTPNAATGNTNAALEAFARGDEAGATSAAKNLHDVITRYPDQADNMARFVGSARNAAGVNAIARNRTAALQTEQANKQTAVNNLMSVMRA